MNRFLSLSMRSSIKRIMVAVIMAAAVFSGVLYMQTDKSYGADLKEQNQSKGIDVSAFNGFIDWSKVKNDGNVEWAIIRAGGRYGGSGKIYDDSYFSYNIENATKQNIPVGVYFFSQAVTEAEAREEADYICDKIKGYNIDLPVAIDIEITAGCRQNQVGVDQLTKIALAFCEEVSLRGYTPMVYSNLYELNNRMNLAKLSNYNIWVAQYYKECQLKSDYYIWQYSSEGRVSGIKDNVDMNILYKDKLKAGYGWIKTGGRYRYLNHDGTYCRNQWKQIDGRWFYFDKDGWMVTGWINYKSKWYYADSSGYMLTGWQKIGGSWYYLYEDGHMAADEIVDGWKLQNSGKCIEAGWKKNSRGWWYRLPDGSYYRYGWHEIDGGWFYFDKEDYVMTGWLYFKNHWYYLSNAGYMVTGWQKIGDYWYYFYSDGHMASDELVDGWKLYSSGKCVKEGWRQNGDGWWYRTRDGGYYRDGWQKIGGYWYYFYEDGIMASRTYIDGYYLGASGRIL